MNEWMKCFTTKFTFNYYNHEREQNTIKITNLVTGSNKIAQLVKVGPKYKNQYIHLNLFSLESTY